VTEEDVKTDNQTKEQEAANSKWEGKEIKNDKPTQWGTNCGEPTVKGEDPRGGGNDHAHTTHDPLSSAGSEQKTPCENCGMFNHATRDCRRYVCEICGFNNHSTFECKRCLP